MTKKDKQEALYSISPHGNTNRSLLWCDDKWYETTPGSAFIFTKEDVERIKTQLPNHYVLNAIIRSKSGEVEEWKAFQKKVAENAENVATNEFDIVCEI